MIKKMTHEIARLTITLFTKWILKAAVAITMDTAEEAKALKQFNSQFL